MSDIKNRDLEKGEVVVIATPPLKEGLTVRQRTLIVQDGFGMSRAAVGTAIMGPWLDGSGEGMGVRHERYQIDWDETKAFQAEHGRFHDPPEIKTFLFSMTVSGKVGALSEDGLRSQIFGTERQWLFNNLRKGWRVEMEHIEEDSDG